MQSRFRLRLFVQEFDLRPGATRIGRSSSCTITIDDPSISREHAEIVVNERGARIRDLGSRNGVRVNGVRIERETELRVGDKLRLGQQDIVVIGETNRGLARTSRSRACRACDVPYSVELEKCPVCGAPADSPAAESPPTTETLALDVTDHPTPVQRVERTAWWLLLHAELLEKATAKGKLSEAEQTLTRVDEAFAAAILAGESYDGVPLEPVLSAAVSYAIARGHGRWLAWVFETMRAFRVVPGGALVAQLESAPPELLHEARVALASYVAESRDRSPVLDGLQAIAASLSSTPRLRTHPPSVVTRAS